jgi:hypothetical protein
MREALFQSNHRQSRIPATQSRREALLFAGHDEHIGSARQIKTGPIRAC